MKAKVSDSERLKIQILILEEQKREVSERQQPRSDPAAAVLPDRLAPLSQLLLVNQRWAREYRTLSQFYSQKVRSEKHRHFCCQSAPWTPRGAIC